MVYFWIEILIYFSVNINNKEKTLLSKALEYTNDLDLLSTCFQRGKGSIEACGLKIIYESKK